MGVGFHYKCFTCTYPHNNPLMCLKNYRESWLQQSIIFYSRSVSIHELSWNMLRKILKWFSNTLVISCLQNYIFPKRGNQMWYASWCSAIGSTQQHLRDIFTPQKIKSESQQASISNYRFIGNTGNRRWCNTIGI